MEALGISNWLTKQLKTLSISTPTEIQTNLIPEILKGRDVIGTAKTGSGKTLCFVLPILEQLSIDPYGTYCLVLVPTRELAFQIAEQFRILGACINLKISVVVGGLCMRTQALELSRKPHIVIATPGRLADHVNSSELFFKRVKFLVLDEADRLLDPTFHEDLGIIIDTLPKKRQTLLFTATLTQNVEALIAEKKPFVYSCAPFDTVALLDQRYVFIPSAVRDAHLVYLLLNDFKDKTAIIFTSKSKTCETLRLMLRELGLRSTALHAQMPQNERLSSLAKFKSSIVPILICTDVGSRYICVTSGLDIPTVQVVLNYEVPADCTDYIHRVGRTARAGRGGLSLSIVTERDLDILLSIEEKTGVKMEEMKIDQQKIIDILNQVSLAKRSSMVELLEKNFGLQKSVNTEKGTIVKKMRAGPILGVSKKRHIK